MFRTAKVLLMSVWGLVLVTIVPSVLYAAAIVVNNLSDPAPGPSATICVLRDAITAANSEAAVNGCAAGNGTDSITFSLSGTITLSGTGGGTLPNVVHTLTIDGTGQTVTIDGAGKFQILIVNSGAALTLNDLTVANGSINHSPSSLGGGVQDNGALTVTDCTFSGNSAVSLGLAEGGAIGVGGSGTLTVTDSTFSGNNSPFSFNTMRGGAIENSGTGAVTISGSTFSGNSAGSSSFGNAFGGSIDNSSSGTVTITNSTFSDNSAVSLNNGGLGGAIYNAGTLTVTNSTFSGNSTTGGGGGSVNNTGALTVTNSILANNTGGNCGGTITDGGDNISDDHTCGFTGTGANGHPIGDGVTDANIALDPGGLANNGGPTFTIKLLPNSFAIDAVALAHSCPATDQRGVTRPDNGESACDIGAYEFQDPGNFTLNTAATEGYQVQHFDVATHVAPSASGYGGPGNSGGSGDALVRIVNASHSDSTQNGTLCAMIYVFDDNEEQQACCGCPVTPDGLRSLSVINDLTSNLGVNGANRSAGVIEVITSPLNFKYNSGTPVVPGINKDTNGQNFACDPSFGQGAAIGAGTAINVTIPSPGMRAWENHTESIAPVAPASGFVTGVPVEEFATSKLDGIEALNLTTYCARQFANGSGSGVCMCGAGDNASSRALHSSNLR